MRKQLCNICGQLHYGSVREKNFICKTCSNDIRAEKMRGAKRPNMNCNGNGQWNIIEDDFDHLPEDVKQAIRCVYFVNRPLADRLIKEAKTYDDVIRIRYEYERENRKGQTFGVVQYG